MTDQEIKQAAKRELERPQQEARQRRQTEAALSELRDSIQRLSAVTYDGVRVSSAGPGRAVEDAVCRLQALYDQLAAENIREWDERSDTWSRINQLTDERHREVLVCRYVCFMDWDSIREQMGYEASQCFKIHGDALLAFGREIMGLGKQSAE